MAKKGVAESGGTPREFTAITVTDVIAMGHAGMKTSLVSREIIADSLKLTVRGHGYDGLAGIAGCDKTLPGIMMAMLRLDVPSVFLYCGSTLPGQRNNKTPRSLTCSKPLAHTRPAAVRSGISTP